MDMSDEKPKRAPWYKPDYVRWKARFEAYYQAYRATGGDEGLPDFDDSDVKDFVKSQPIQGERLQTLNTIGTICSVAGIVGGAGAYLLSYRYSKAAGQSALAAVFGAGAASLLADDVCSWTYKTWKFDPLAPREAFAEWIIQKKLAEAEGESPNLPTPRPS